MRFQISVIRHTLIALGLMAALFVTGCETSPFTDTQPASTIAAPGTCARADVLAQFPHGNFLENLIVQPSGRVLFTSYVARSLESHGRDGNSLFALLSVHPVSLIPHKDGLLVAAHGESFMKGPAFTASNMILVLDRHGKVRKRFAQPHARFLNGMQVLPGGQVLVADSILGRIWKFNPANGKMSLWLDVPELKADAAGKDPRPGVNGLKLFDGALYFSNSFTGRIFRMPVTKANRPIVAQLKMVGLPGRVDDFVVARDGTIYAATHADAVLRITAKGDVSTVLPEGGDGATAVAFTDDSQSALYVLTTGNLLDGGKEPARLLQVSLPGGNTMCRGA